MKHNNFDALRLIGALAVLVSHMFALSGRAEPTIVGDHTLGNLGVLIFFSISGHLIAASWTRDPDLGRFLDKRFRRMVPALAVAVPLMSLAVIGLGLWGFPSNKWHLLNGSLWTIPLEVCCYLLLAGMAMLTRSFELTFALLMLVGHVMGVEHVADYSVDHLIDFGMFFAMGCLLNRYGVLRRWGVALVAVGLLLLTSGYDVTLGLALIVPMLTIEVGRRSWPLLNSAGRYGDLSYGIYIYAWPVQQVVVATMGASTPYVTLLAWSGAITVALAYGSWHVIESRALRRSRRTDDNVVELVGADFTHEADVIAVDRHGNGIQQQGAVHVHRNGGQGRVGDDLDGIDDVIDTSAD